MAISTKSPSVAVACGSQVTFLNWISLNQSMVSQGIQNNGNNLWFQKKIWPSPVEDIIYSPSMDSFYVLQTTDANFVNLMEVTLTGFNMKFGGLSSMIYFIRFSHIESWKDHILSFKTFNILYRRKWNLEYSFRWYSTFCKFDFIFIWFFQFKYFFWLKKDSVFGIAVSSTGNSLYFVLANSNGTMYSLYSFDYSSNVFSKKDPDLISSNYLLNQLITLDS